MMRLVASALFFFVLAAPVGAALMIAQLVLGAVARLAPSEGNATSSTGP